VTEWLIYIKKNRQSALLSPRASFSSPPSYPLSNLGFLQSKMTGITISDLPPELLYTVLSHLLADVLFDYLFVGALLPNHHHDYHRYDQSNPAPAPAAVEIRSIGGVSVAWRITLQRILGALLHSPNRDDGSVQSHKRHRAHLHHRQLTNR
jgi:hypothetical protein